ncbi:MAG: prolipoprotein diacylglyceryl transferase [Oscillospiraceae bacterium]|nr:prolipoprotein diacylglyceryl transferase [Oscillospiraceae bacterium]
MNPSNYSYISFPFLGIEVNPPRTLSIGPLTAHYYGLIIAVGLILAVLYACRRSKEFGIKEDDILDGVLWVTPFAIVCARIYYVAFSWADYASNPISVLYIWEGGIAIYGGVIGAIIGMYGICRVKKIKFTTVLDLILMVFLIGQSIGRWGNFMNREAFGAATDSFFRMGLFNEKNQGWEYYHPTFLYESVWNLIGFVLLASLCGKRKYDGQIALGYAAWYGLGRAFIEGLRVDSLWWGPFRVSQVLAAITCLTAVAVLLWQNTKPHDPAKLYVNQIAAMEAEKKAE